MLGFVTLANLAATDKHFYRCLGASLQMNRVDSNLNTSS